MDATNLGLQAPNGSPLDSNDSNATAAEWARTPGRWWVTKRVDVVRGLIQRLDLTDNLLRALLLGLMGYAVYLAWCEGCKNEYYEFAVALWTAVVDFVSLSRGQFSAAMVGALIVWLLTVKTMRRPPPIYLVDFKTYRHKVAGGGDGHTAGEPVTYERFLEESKQARHLDDQPCFTEKSLAFQEKILRTSCISETSIFPSSIFAGEGVGHHGKDAERVALNMGGARDEAAAMMCKAVEDLLEATGTRPQDVGVLIVNCSLFCPTPSLSAMLVNRFRMRADVLSYNLGGMGCSASVIAVDLAKRLLRSPEQRNSLALVVSTENITQNWYRGNDRSMLLSNCLFRCGAAALLISNRRADASRARFMLRHTVRTHMGSSDECYSSVYQQEDDEGIRGVRLSKQIMQIAGDALKRNITNLGPLVLPVSEQLKFFFNIAARRAVRGRLPLPAPLRRLFKGASRRLVTLPLVRTLVGYQPHRLDTPAAPGSPRSSEAAPPTAASPTAAAASPTAAAASDDAKAASADDAAFLRALPPYVPDFTKAFEYICVHTGGRAVIDAMEHNLALPPHYLEPSRLSLYKYGNVSSASIWYELELVAEHGNQCGAQRDGGALPPPGCARRLRRGDRIWQIAFGSGFKCNSAVWQSLRNC